MGKITIRYFAIFREAFGGEEEVELSSLDEATVAGVWNHVTQRSPKFEGREGFVRFAINREFVEISTVVKDGDEVALIPPVSGGNGNRFAIVNDVLSIDAVVALVRRPEAGAIVTFEGVVRNHTGDHAVDYLEYEVYEEMALVKLAEVAHRVESKYDEVRIAIHHRYGRLDIGDAAVVIAVSAPHRADAYAASQATIDALKHEVPIFKKEVGPGGEEWVGWGP